MVPTKLRRRGAAIGLSLLIPLASVPASAASNLDSVAVPLMMRGPEMTPDKAAALRVAPQSAGRTMIDAGEAAEAGVAYDRAASEFGDPVLYLDAGDAYLVAAESAGDTELCDVTIERAAIALDLLYFSIDKAADANFQMVETSDIPDLIARAQALQDAAEEAKQRIIDAANAPVAATAADNKKKRPKGNGKWMKVGGIGLASVGGALTVMGVVGLGIGAVNQSRADDPAVYGDEYDDVEAKGQRGNLIAGLGFGIGGAAAIAGITLYFVGKRREKKAGTGGDKEEKAMEDEPIVRIAPTLNGMAVTGRF